VTLSESSNEISFRLSVRRDPVRRKWWLVVPLNVGETGNLVLVPNSVASRSVITPPAFRRLREAGLIGADIFDFPSGRLSCILSNVRIADQAAPDLKVRVRDVDELLVARDEYVVDGYLGLDYLFGAFTSLTIDTQRLRVTLGLHPRGTA
jgi:hypothetical protein